MTAAIAESSASPPSPVSVPTPPPEAAGLTRRILASSERVRAYWQGKGPGVIVFMNKSANVRIRVKDVLAHRGTLPAAWRRIKVEIQISHLSQAAREIFLAVPEPDPRQRSCDYRFETGLSLAQVFLPDGESRQVWGQGFWSQPFCWTLHWPTLLDEETGEAYYERCARLVELTRSLFTRGVPPGQIAGLVGSAERLAGDWDVRRVTSQLLERHQKRSPAPRRPAGIRKEFTGS